MPAQGESGRRVVLRSAVFLYLFTAAKLLAPLVTLPYLTRVLSVEVYGLVSYTKAMIAYVQLVIDFGFIFSATKSVVLAKGDRATLSRIVGNTVLEKALLGLVVLAGSAVAIETMPIFHGHEAFAYLSVAGCLTTIGVVDFLHRGVERMENVAVPFVISKVVMVAATFLFVRGDDSYLMIPLLDIVSSLVASAISIILMLRMGIGFSLGVPVEWFRDLRASFIYFASNFATTFLGVFATLVVGAVLSNREVAFWALCMMVVGAVKSLYTPLVNSLFPRMVETKDLSLANRVAAWGLAPTLAIALGAFLLGEGMMSLVAGDAYASAGSVLRWLSPVLFVSFYSMLYGWPVLGAIGREREATIATIGASAVQVLGVAVLVAAGRFDLTSLAISTVVAEVCFLLFRIGFVRRFVSDFRTVG